MAAPSPVISRLCYSDARRPTSISLIRSSHHVVICTLGRVSAKFWSFYCKTYSSETQNIQYDCHQCMTYFSGRWMKGGKSDAAGRQTSISLTLIRYNHHVVICTFLVILASAKFYRSIGKTYSSFNMTATMAFSQL